jgi:hypothetical protein
MDDLDDIWGEVSAEGTEPDEVIDNPIEIEDDDFEGADEDQPIDDDETDIEEDADTDDDSPPADDDSFDWNEILERHGERTVTVTVQGEPVEVRIKDLPEGFMRREDYSRKTAEVAQDRKAATWARDVQEAFDKDPYGTLEAFARAYNVQFGGPPPQDVVDPYEDFDPEVAQALRQRDQLLVQQQQRLDELSQQFSSVENQRIMAEVKAEVAGLREEFGDDLDHVEMLRIAAEYNMPLRDAAEHLVGKQYYSRSRQRQELDSQAGELGKARSEESRKTAKRRASGTSTKKFDASSVSVEDFDDIGELFTINLNSIT